MTAVRRSLTIKVLIALTACLVATAITPAAARKAPKPKPEPCPTARYLIAGDPILSSGTGTGMQLGSSIALDELCGPVAAKRYQANRKGVTQVMARWKQCSGLAGAVVLQGKVLPGCGQFEGKLKAKKLKRKIDAALSRCGDGIVDAAAGEECDDGNTTPGDGCEPDCRLTPPSTTTTTTPASTTTTVTFVTTTTTLRSVTTTTTTPGVTTTTLRSATTTTVPGATTTTTTLPKTQLGLVVVANPDPIVPAGLLTYDLTATNRGPVDAVQAQVRLTLPTGVFSCAAPSDGGQLPTGCAAARDVVWALGTLPAGTSRAVRIVIQVRGDLTAGTSLLATGRLNDAAQSPEADAQATVGVQTAAPLSLGLTEGPDPVQVGDDLEYALRFGNSGANALLATQLMLTLPAGVSVVDAGGGTAAGGTITWALGALNAAQTGERRVRVQVADLGAVDPLVRVARADLTTGATAARAGVVTQVQPTALGLEVVAEPDPLVPAGLLTYRLTVTNRGAADAEQVELRLTLPVGLFACGPLSDGGTLPDGCLAGRDAVWTFDALAAGTSRSVQAVIQVSNVNVVPGGTILSTTARVQDAAGSRTRAGLSTTVQVGPPLDLVLTTDGDPVQVGDDLEYALRFGNGGANALLATQLMLTLPAGVSVVDAGGGTAAGGTITWALGALNAAQTGERRVRVQVADLGAVDPLVRVARADLTTGATAARAGVVTQVQPTALGLEVVAEPDPLVPAGLLTYRLTVTNRGAADAEQVELRLTLPVGLFACGPLSDGGTLPDGCLAGRDAVWTFDALAAGTSRSVQAVIQVSNVNVVPGGTILSTTARVQDAAGSRTRAGLSTTVQVGPPLDLVLTTDGDPVQVGDDLEYALRFGNSGANALLATQLMLTLPAGVSVVDAGGGTAAGGTITWALGALNAAQTGERRVRVQVADLGAVDPLVRVARADLTTGATAARAGVVTQVQPTALGLEVVAEPDPLVPAGLLTYRLTVTNRGAADAEQVELRLTLPVGLFACGPLSDGGTLPDGCLAGRDAVWTFDALAAGTSRSVQAVIQVSNVNVVPGGTILSTTARVQDAAGSRTRAGLSTTVQVGPPLDLVLTTDGDPVQVGDDLEYALRFGNSGANALLATQLVLTLPAGVSVVDAGGGTAAGGTITWALGALNAAQTGERRVRVQVADLGAVDPLVRVARADLTTGATAARAGVVTQVQPATLGLAVTAAPDPVAPAGLLTYHLTVANNGTDDSVQVELRLTLPVGLFACGTLSDGGTATDGCLAGRDVLWNLGTIAAGDMRQVQAVIQISNVGAVPSGTILSTTARVQDAAGSRTQAALSTAVEK